MDQLNAEFGNKLQSNSQGQFGYKQDITQNNVYRASIAKPFYLLAIFRHIFQSALRGDKTKLLDFFSGHPQQKGLWGMITWDDSVRDR